MRAALALTVGVLALGTTGCTEGGSPTTETAERPAAAPYSRSKTLSCLRSEGATVDALRPANQQLRALRDLAQGRSFEVHVERSIFAIAFARDVAAAQLLVELVSVPGGSYDAVRSGNVVVLHQSEGSALNAALARCLRD